ncbi:hypothetical protein [Planomonospora sp. ID82291]|uniref:hypothetical protein n=1 Tax=Planomonospora sp. ID82291 TaxID=2738136 RepID=UPI0018C3783D|nr:hypothetical protein [Planomonospora sp. ID82291]MBG0818395.1 hypothetical protein [Planomonospora sp. ID82291]
MPSSKGTAFKPSPDGEITRTDAKVYPVSYRTNTIFRCRTDVIKTSAIAGWTRL